MSMQYGITLFVVMGVIASELQSPRRVQRRIVSYVLIRTGSVEKCSVVVPRVRRCCISLQNVFRLQNRRERRPDHLTSNWMSTGLNEKRDSPVDIEFDVNDEQTLLDIAVNITKFSAEDVSNSTYGTCTFFEFAIDRREV